MKLSVSVIREYADSFVGLSWEEARARLGGGRSPLTLFEIMKALKLILGVLAGLFVVFHLIEIPGKLGAVSGDLAFSWWMGKLAAILVGSAISVALCRSAIKGQQ